VSRAGLPVSIRTRFERFPATVKGAFVIRGEDPNPHQVSFLRGRVVRVPGGTVRTLTLDAVVLDVVPHQDTFVPFEFSIAELGPGWYGLESDVDVDGSPRTLPGDRRFVVPWPRSSVRRGTVQVDRALRLETGELITVPHLECQHTTITVPYSVLPPRALDLRLFADGVRVDRLEESFDAETGQGHVVTYPLAAGARTLRIEVAPAHRRGRAGGADIEVALP
jgi:hypothetical protein